MPSRRFTLGVLVLLVVTAGVLILVGLHEGGGPGRLASSTVLVFHAPYQLEEVEPPRGAFPMRALRRAPLTMWQVIAALRAAAKDDRIAALVVHISDLDWGWGKISELRDALLDFQAHGKPVYASLTGGNEGEYLLATGAGTVAMPPAGVLQLDGLSIHALFLRGTFDKLGITPNFAQVGRFKSAPEAYTRGTMSASQREELTRLLEDEFSVLLDSLAGARSMPVDSARALIDRGPFTAPEAVQAGWVDTLLHDDEVDSLAVAETEADEATVTLSEYLSHVRPRPTGPRIALIVASGTIVSGRSRGSTAMGWLVGSETLIDALREARERPSVKAVVLRVDSPGGEGMASDAVWNEIVRCARVKPVIASMSDLAASGGYYLAMGAAAIVAHPATITGSIGVYGGKFNRLGLFRKLGLNVEGVSRGRHAEMLSPYRDFTEEERALFERQLDDFYRAFVSKVARSRKLDVAEVDSMGQGRVWSGKSAQTLGLIDKFGGIPAALELAKRKAGLDPKKDVAVVVYPRVERTFLERLLAELFREDEEEEASGLVPSIARVLASVAALPDGSPWALLPVTLEFR